MKARTVLALALVAAASLGCTAQELLDFSYKAAHNSFERPYDSPYDYDDLVGLYNFNIFQMGVDLANGHLFHMLTTGDQRLPLGYQVGWLNTWSLELDICWRSDGATLVRHFPGMQPQVLTTMLDEYWNDDIPFYQTRDRFTIFWFEWKTDSECTPFSDTALAQVRAEILQEIPSGVIFTTRDLLEFNGLDPEGPYTVADLTWPSPQWLFVHGFRVMFVSQDGEGGRFMFTAEFVANKANTTPDFPENDGQIWRMYPNLASEASDFATTDINEFLGALGQFNPWGYTRDSWETALQRGYNIIATNDVNDAYSVYWGEDYPAGYRWAPPMPMYVGGTVWWSGGVLGTAANPYSRLRFAEFHLRHAQTISGSGITDPWPVLIEGGTHAIDQVQSNRFEPQIPMRLEAKSGQTVRLVPGN